MLNRQRIGTFVLGGVAGVLAGILLAPRSGKELRGSITSRVGEARERSRESFFDAQEQAWERFAEVRDRPPSTIAPEHAAGPGSADPIFETHPEEPPGPPPNSPPLRDVSRDAEPVPGGDLEDLRRRIRETRSRLQKRLDGGEDV